MFSFEVLKCIGFVPILLILIVPSRFMCIRNILLFPCLISSVGSRLSRCSELCSQWDCVLRSGPASPLCWDDLDIGIGVGLDLFTQRLWGLLASSRCLFMMLWFIRRDFGIQEKLGTGGPTCTPVKVASSSPGSFFPFLSYDTDITPRGSGVLVDPDQFRKAWLPFFCGGCMGVSDLDASPY